MSVVLKALSACPTTGKVNTGAALPMKGEGTSRGFRNKPLAKKPTKTTKKTSGSHLFMGQAPWVLGEAESAVARALAPMR